MELLIIWVFLNQFALNISQIRRNRGLNQNFRPRLRAMGERCHDFSVYMYRKE